MTEIYTSGCAQRGVLDSGDIILPCFWGPEGRADRAVGSLRCTFDGETMPVVESGNELRNTTGRGLEGKHIAGQSSLDASQLRTVLEGIPVVCG